MQKQDVNMQKWILIYSPGFHSMFEDYCILATASKLPGNIFFFFKESSALPVQDKWHNKRSSVALDAFTLPCSTMTRYIFSIRNPARSGFMLCLFSQTGPPTAPDKELKAPCT